jgi:transcriptional regulator
MHPTALFRVDDRARLLAHLARHPFATLVASLEGRLIVAHAPVVIRDLPGGLALDFHLSGANALAPHIPGGFRVVAASLAAEAYISPDWHVDKGQVPTWNYLTVEAEGMVTPLDKPGLIALLDDLGAQEEARLAPKPPWTRAKMAPGRFETMLTGIIGARLAVERLEGTFKLSQNKPETDRAGVIAALGDHPIARAMRE